MKWYFFLLLYASETIFATVSPSLLAIDEAIRRIQAHLVIKDAQSALSEVDEYLSHYPSGKERILFLKLKIQCASTVGNETALLASYKELRTLSSEEAQNPAVLEHIAWGVIRKAESSDSPLIRLEGAFAAFISNDAKGIMQVQKALDDQNVKVRQASLEFSASLRDEIIQKTTFEKALHDPSKEVKIAAIACLGKMRKNAVKEELKHIIEDKNTSAEEKYVAIDALTNILQNIDPPSFKTLVESNRSFLKILACKLGMTAQQKDLLPYIIPLLHDSNTQVKVYALQAVGTLMSSQEFQQSDAYREAKALLSHTEWRQQITTLWLLSLLGTKDDAKNAHQELVEWTRHNNPEARVFAAAALIHTGSNGASSMVYALKKSLDPYVKMTLAIGLIYQQHEVPFAAHYLEETMNFTKERIGWEQEGIFSWIGQSQIPHSAQKPRLPETHDFLTRLELYSVIATCDPTHLREKLELFFKERSWGISGSAASLLIQEGDPGISDVLRSLLHDPSCEIALQAAYILALYTQDPEALPLFEKKWKEATREQKELILYAIGSIGSPTSIPFLASILDEPFQTLRIRAASSILQCVYH